jgi:hypothetical protein
MVRNAKVQYCGSRVPPRQRLDPAPQPSLSVSPDHWGAPAARAGRRASRHASITTTLNLFEHLLPSLDVELAERLDDVRAALCGTLNPPEVIEIEAAKR